MASQAAVILAAGQSTRMKSAIPKVLHQACGRELISLVTNAAENAGFNTIVVVVPPNANLIRNVLGNRVKYVVQRKALGTGHALLQSQQLLKGIDNIAVLHGDVPLIRSETITCMMKRHVSTVACMTLLSAKLEDSEDLGRIIRDESGQITGILESSQVNSTPKSIIEVNSGIYCFQSSWLWPNLGKLNPSSNGEVFLTDLVAIASEQKMMVDYIQSDQPQEVLGINTRVQMAKAEGYLRQTLREHWMLSGVTLKDPDSIYIDFDATLGQDTVILPNSHISGSSYIGQDCEIGPNTTINNSNIGDKSRIVSSVVENSTVDKDVVVGPFSHIRSNSHLENKVRVGNFAEVKKSRLGKGTKLGHFSYVGDAEVGTNVNIGAGTVTCNYDGTNKHQTRIEDGAFIGSASMLIAPVTIGARSSTGAGSIVNTNVPPESQAIGAPAKIRTKKPRT